MQVTGVVAWWVVYKPLYCKFTRLHISNIKTLSKFDEIIAKTKGYIFYWDIAHTKQTNTMLNTRMYKSCQYCNALRHFSSLLVHCKLQHVMKHDDNND